MLFSLLWNGCILSTKWLIHLPLDKMATHRQMTFSNAFFVNENDRILIRISLKVVSSSPVVCKWMLAQVMAWHSTGDKPLPEPMLTKCINTNIGHWGRWFKIIIYLTIFYTVTSLALCQSYDCHSGASEVILKYMENPDQYQVARKHDKVQTIYSRVPLLHSWIL